MMLWRRQPTKEQIAEFIQARRQHMNDEMVRCDLWLPDPNDLKPPDYEDLHPVLKKAVDDEVWATIGANLLTGPRPKFTQLALFDLPLRAAPGWCVVQGQEYEL